MDIPDHTAPVADPYRRSVLDEARGLRHNIRADRRRRFMAEEVHLQRLREQLVMCVLPVLILGISLLAWVVNMLEQRQLSQSDWILWWFSAFGTAVLAPLVLFGVPYYRRRPVAGLMTSFSLLVLCPLTRATDYWPEARIGACAVSAGVGAAGTIGYTLALLLVMLRQTPTNLLKCRYCGYDLRGNRSGRCPECGRQLGPRQRRFVEDMPTETGGA